MKKAISAVITVLVFMTVLIVVLIMFSSFQKTGIYQVQSQFARLKGEVPEVPCTRGPEVDAGGTIWLEPTQQEAVSSSFQINTTINATGTASSCFENLSLSWDFGDGTPTETKECYYSVQDRTYKDNLKNEDCLFFNHTYHLTKYNVGETFFIRLYAEGMKSGYTGSDTADVFVSDPTLNIEKYEPFLYNNYPCVSIHVRAGGMREGASTGLNGLSKEKFKIIDNYLEQNIESFDDLGGGDYFINYRSTKYELGRRVAGGVEPHRLTIEVKPSYQTAKKEVDYTPATISPKEELIILGYPGDLIIYNYHDASNPLNLMCWSERANCQVGGVSTDIVTNKGDNWKGITAGDFDGDGQVEIAGLHTPGDIRIYAYNGSSMTEEFWSDKGGDVIPNKAYYGITSGDYNGDGAIEIVTMRLEDNEVLSIYRYNGYSITEVANNKDNGALNPDVTEEQITSGDVDGDGKDEIIIVANYKQNNIDASYLHVRTYDGSSINFYVGNPSSEISYVPHWLSMTTSDLNGNGKDEVILLGKYSDGSLSAIVYELNETKQFEYVRMWGPGEANKDFEKIVAGDYNGDGAPEVIFLSKDKIWVRSSDGFKDMGSIDISGDLAKDVKGADLYDVWCA